MVLPVLWWIQGLGYGKAAITVTKYSPQVYINYKLQSTGAPHYRISCEDPRSFG
jgi:translation initiation factor 2 alpha subunit (eIF-2alpha)